MYVRRASFVLALTLAIAAMAPAPAAAQAARTGPSQWAVLVGMEDGPGPTGIQLRGDLEFPMQRLAPEIGFSIVGQVGFSRFSESGSYGIPGYPAYQDKWETSLNLLKFGGTARFSFGHAQIRPYADAGLGIYYAGLSASQTTWDPYYGYTTYSGSDSETSLFMHLAAGATFPVNPRFSLGLELGFNPYFGDLDETYTSLLASATFRM